MKRIIVSVTNDLVTDQRVYKVCKTLYNNGFDILLIGRKFKISEDLNRNYKTYRFKLLFNKGALFYAEYNLRLFFKLLFTKKDILLANDLDTLLPNYLNSLISKSKLVYDSHELYTEVPELIHRPFTQKIWLQIEKFVLPKLKNCYTVSQPIANYYNNHYKTNFKLIRNFPFQTFEIKKGTFPFKNENHKIILYQGALNKGRGLELMFETIPFINNAIFVVIGTGEIETFLKQQVIDQKIDHLVKFIPKTNPTELKKLTLLADLGISLEEDLGLNYRYALPNKLFDYIQAEVPILVSDLPEMKNIISTYNVGEVVLNRNPKALATQINIILQKTKYYEAALQKAKNKLTWENESKNLIEIYKNLE